MCTRCDEYCADFSQFVPLPPGIIVDAPSVQETPSVIYCNQCKDYCSRLSPEARDGAPVVHFGHVQAKLHLNSTIHKMTPLVERGQ